ncbi:extracellular solute-binding protein [Saccharopolyspora erythraea]|nr:extracellular solute-binding protein [Saccharopolyspora erythraea]
MWTSKMTRRQGFRAFAGAAAGLAAAGCTQQAAPQPGRPAMPGQPVELEFWAWVPGMDEVVATWNRQRPDIQVHYVEVPAGADGAYPKLYAALEAGAVPDLVQIEFMELPNAVLNRGLVDLLPLGVSAHRHEFVDWTYEQVSFGGGVYAVPQASGPVATFYRKDLFDEWGLTPPATWEEFERVAERVREHDAYLTTFPTNNSEVLSALCWQAGSIWFGADERQWVVDVDNPATHRVTDFWQRLIDRDLVDTIPNSGNAFYKSVQDGRIVSLLGAHWHAEVLEGNAENTAGKWAVARMPQWDAAGPVRTTNLGGSVTSVVRGSRFPAQALEFALWLNTDPATVSDLVVKGMGFPALADLSRVPAMDEAFGFFGGQRINDVFRESSESVDNSWKWLPTTNQALEHINAELQGMASGGRSLHEIAVDAEAQIIRDLEKKGLPHRS